MKVRREGMAWLAAAWFAAILPAGGAEQAAIAIERSFPRMCRPGNSSISRQKGLQARPPVASFTAKKTP